jgi:hypothetical protein
VLLHVRLAATTPPAVFEAYLRGEPGVLHAWHTAGDIDFEVHLICDGVSDLHALLTRARRDGGAQDTTTQGGHHDRHRNRRPRPTHTYPT